MKAYFKLLDYLNRIGMSKEEFRKLLKIAPATMAKISKNEPISLSVIDKICEILNCQPGDILEYYEPANKQIKNKNVKIAIEREPLEIPDRKIIDVKVIEEQN